MDNLVSTEAIDPVKKQWFDSLGYKFITAEAVKSGAELGICKRMAMYMLADLKEKNIINKLQQGEYEKEHKRNSYFIAVLII